MSRVLLLFVLLPAILHGGDGQRVVRAVRVDVPPVIDGLLDDSVWQRAEPADGFLQRDPKEGQPASEPSDVRVLYDDRALYVGWMFYDQEPEKIVARLTRRDNEIESDWGSVRIDSYHDHQTCFEFTFNAAGVRADILQYDDADKEDESWDPVWAIETRLLSNGWSAELRIPFAVLRYQAEESDTAEYVWGINFIRTISRKQETDRWVFTPKRESGFVSRFGHLAGLRAIPAPHRFELLPFVVARQQWDPPTSTQFGGSTFHGEGGLDLKWGMTNSFTLDATINPDFGQVEADPAVLNLSTFETFYPEKRPFFVEGTQMLRFSTFSDDGAGPGMFYSRRIGRGISPSEVSVPAGGHIEEIPQAVTILGAAKLTGKTRGGLSVGFLQAVTQKAEAVVVDSAGVRASQMLEPLAHYGVLRLRQDVMDRSNVGMIFTAVEKETRLPALTGGLDWDLKPDSGTYQIKGFLAASHTTAPDNSRLTGSAGRMVVSRLAAVHWLWSVQGDFTTPRYNINDVGFFRRPDDWGGIASLTYKEDQPGDLLRTSRVGTNVHYRWNFDGANLFRTASLQASFELLSYWWGEAEMSFDAGDYDDRETRGNGLYRKPHSWNVGATIGSDMRDPVLVHFTQRFGSDEHGKRLTGSALELEVNLIPWMQWEVEARYEAVRGQEAWVENIYDPPPTTSIFADRSTDESGLTLRGTVTFTRELTLQLYGQLFLAKGHYDNFRVYRGESDFTPFTGTLHQDFSVQSVTTNAVLRWEYIPGSTMFLVWSHSRNGEGTQYFTSLGDDLRNAFRVAPANVLMLKVSYWLSM